MRSNAKRRAERWGRIAERLACWLLRVKGYRVLTTRFRTPRGEIDIIARKGAVLALIEVKARARQADALAAVQPRNQKRLMEAAALFVAGRPELASLSLRFDVIAITPTAWPRHIRSAFGHGADSARLL